MGTQITGIHTHTQAWIKNVEGGTVTVPALLFITFLFWQGFEN